MKLKKIVWILIAAIAVSVVSLVPTLTGCKDQPPQEPPQIPESTEEPADTTAAQAPAQTDPAAEKEEIMSQLMQDVLASSDRLYERTLVEYKRKISDEPPYWGTSMAGFEAAREGRYAEAIDTIQRRLQTSPNDLNFLYLLAWTYAKIPQLTEAENYSSQCLQIDPKFSRAALLKAWIKIQEDDHAAAMEICKKAQEANPVAAGPYYGMGRLYALDEKFDQAIDSYNEAIRFRPDVAEVHLNLGLVYEQADQTTKALEAFRKAINLKEQYPEAHFLMGTALDKAGRHEAASTAYQKAMVQQANFPEAQLFMGIKSLRLEDYQTAQRYFNQALSMQPDYPQAHVGLAFSHMMTGQFDRAKQEWKLLESTNPDMAKEIAALLEQYASKAS